MQRPGAASPPQQEPETLQPLLTVHRKAAASSRGTRQTTTTLQCRQCSKRLADKVCNALLLYMHCCPGHTGTCSTHCGSIITILACTIAAVGTGGGHTCPQLLAAGHNCLRPHRHRRQRPRRRPHCSLHNRLHTQR